MVRPSDSCNNVYEAGNSVREPPRSSDHRDVLRRPRLPIFVHVCAAGVLRAAKFGINAVSVMFKYNQSISDGTSGGQKSCGQCRQPGACRCDGFSMAFWVPPVGSRRRSRDAVAFLVCLLNSIHVLSLFRNIKSLRARRHRAADALGQLAPVTTGALATGLTAQRSRIRAPAKQQPFLGASRVDHMAVSAVFFARLCQCETTTTTNHANPSCRWCIIFRCIWACHDPCRG